MDLARSPTALVAIRAQFARREVRKTYLALVRAGAETFKGLHSGTVDAPLVEGRGGMRLAKEAERGLSEKARPALTEWELLGPSPTVPLSLLRICLYSGHRHQLRVHCAECLNGERCRLVEVLLYI